MESKAHMLSRIWLEEPEEANAFAARSAHCHGYDVFGDMLGHARWADMIYLLFRGEAPTAPQAAAMDLLAVALANPGPRDASVHAAMCGGSRRIPRRGFAHRGPSRGSGVPGRIP